MKSVRKNPANRPHAAEGDEWLSKSPLLDLAFIFSFSKGCILTMALAKVLTKEVIAQSIGLTNAGHGSKWANG